MCIDNSATSLCGTKTVDYYNMKPQLSHTDLNLCGTINVYIVKMLYEKGITASTSGAEYDVGSPFLDHLLEEFKMKQTGSDMFETTFFPLMRQRVSYYISMLDGCGAFLVDGAAPRGALKVWRAFQDWQKMGPVAIWMQTHRILHDDRVDRLGFTFAEICDEIPDASSVAPDFMSVDLATLGGARLETLLSQANLEFHRVAGRARRLQGRLDDVLRVSKGGSHGEATVSEEDLARKSELVLEVDLRTLSRGSLDGILRVVGGWYLDSATQAGKIKERMDRIIEEKIRRTSQERGRNRRA